MQSNCKILVGILKVGSKIVTCYSASTKADIINLARLQPSDLKHIGSLFARCDPSNHLTQNHIKIVSENPKAIFYRTRNKALRKITRNDTVEVPL